MTERKYQEPYPSGISSKRKMNSIYRSRVKEMKRNRKQNTREKEKQCQKE